MAVAVKVKIHGLKDIRAAMMELPKRVDQKLLNEGLLKGARIVRDEAKARVPLLKEPNPRRRRGTIQRAIQAIRVRPEGMSAKVWVRVRRLTKKQVERFKRGRAKGGKGLAGRENPNDPFYWIFVELGTSKMAARPFLRPAFESKKDESVRVAVAHFRERVQQEIAKAGRRSIWTTKI